MNQEDCQLTYYIREHNKTEEAGKIDIRFGLASSNFFANIGYNVLPQYQGRNYALRALKMLKEIMIKKGLNKPRITTYPENIPSIRVAERFGGKLLDGPEYNDKSYITYKVDLAEDNVHTM